MVHVCYIFHGFMHVANVFEIRDHCLASNFESEIFFNCGSNMLCFCLKNIGRDQPGPTRDQPGPTRDQPGPTREQPVTTRDLGETPDTTYKGTDRDRPVTNP